ncbi:MAG: FHIPEP family type III secretion protein [Planctomycetales bacterium]|nr:FHIPEP family type III secretion protein [Planctomycetales bacterium]
MPGSSRVQELLLPIGLLASLLVILTPMPAMSLDLLLLGNIALSVIIFLTTIYVTSPLEFSVFPTVLLATTLGRLVLNVATTRSILTRGSTDGLDAAGGVVRRFGEFVAGDQVLVGIVVFGIIAVIQFVVITKGATRISEVSARFALDGMPGKQMAVDADLNAGLIDQVEARRRRGEIAMQADFYGAMDGASKFVRGDAVAGIFITTINIVGGLLLGVTQYGMSLSEAGATFTKLTIGDGLVSQIPALLISLAAGLLVTRSAQKSNLPVEFLQQLLSRPQVLAVAGVFLAVLILTQLPAIPLVMLGSGCIGAAVLLSRREPEVEKPARPATTTATAATPPQQRLEPRIEEYLSVDPVELELGLDLVRLADSKRGGNLLSRITQLRQAVAMELGLVLPKVRIRDNLRLNEDHYRIKIQGNPVATARLPMGVYWAVTDHREEPRGGDGTLRHPAFRYPLQRVTREQLPLVQQSGQTVLDATGVLLHHLRQVVAIHAADLLTRDATKHLLDETHQKAPAVVDELVPQMMRLADVQRILQRLLVEGVSIRQMSLILEALGDEAGRSRSEVELTERVRHRLARSICAQYRDERDRLHVVTLDSAWEERTQSAMQLSERDVATKLSAADVDALARGIDNELAQLRQQGRPEILLVRPEIRPVLKRMLISQLPQLIVLSYSEITAETKVVSLGIVSGTRGK